MSVILGIDIGGSTTKIVGLRRDGSTIAMHRVQAQDPITSLYGALGNFLFTNSLALADVSRIVLTGVGASYVEGDIYGIPTEKVEEFTAVGVGGLALSGQEKAVVVSMGTGTAFIWAERGKEYRHLGGSGMGGGTLFGLCSRLCSASVRERAYSRPAALSSTRLFLRSSPSGRSSAYPRRAKSFRMVFTVCLGMESSRASELWLLSGSSTSAQSSISALSETPCSCAQPAYMASASCQSAYQRRSSRRASFSVCIDTSISPDSDYLYYSPNSYFCQAPGPCGEGQGQNRSCTFAADDI